MLYVRLAKPNDLEAIVALCRGVGAGLTTLPADGGVLSAKLSRAVQANADSEQSHLFLFVLEDVSSGKIVGLSGLEKAIGLDQAHYTYRVGTIVHASPELNVYHQFPTLFLTNDHSGCSELCSLYLDPAFRNNKIGVLLSKARLLFVAQFRALFADKIIAELRGVLDENQQSPFWEGLGRHFFDIDFVDADYLTAVTNKRFIAELMPRYPFYTKFLPPAAQAVIGQVHRETLPAKNVLEAEGFRYEGCVDIFDAGPTLECYTDQVRAVKESYQAYLLQLESLAGYPLLVCNNRKEDFRCALLWPEPNQAHPWQLEQLASVLQIDQHEKVRCVTLNRTE